MPSVSDHVRRDAEHAARSLIRVQVMRYVRRMDEQAKAHIAAAIEAAETAGDPIDGTAIGEDAAARAIGTYMASGEPAAAIDGEVQDELPAAAQNA